MSNVDKIIRTIKNDSWLQMKATLATSFIGDTLRAEAIKKLAKDIDASVELSQHDIEIIEKTFRD